jgi:hypothetical protein
MNMTMPVKKEEYSSLMEREGGGKKVEGGGDEY